MYPIRRHFNHCSKSSILCLSLLFVVSYAVNAQSDHNVHLDYRRAIKVNNVSSYERRLTFRADTGGLVFRSGTTTWQLLHPSFSFQTMDSSRNIHEFELLNFTLNNMRNTAEFIVDSTRSVHSLLYDQHVNVTNISLRYEYIINLVKRKNTRLIPSVGFAFNPQFRLVKLWSNIGVVFPSSERSIVLRSYIIPRLTYHLSEKLLIDLNLPFCLTDFSHNTDTNRDPTIPARQQKISNLNFEAFPPLYSLRLGIGLKI